MTFPFLEKRCFKSVALVAEDKPLTHKLRLLPLLFTEPPTVFFLSLSSLAMFLLPSLMVDAPL